MRRQARQHGFTLLEAIVALTIMATSMIALYGWMVGNTLALRRVEANQRALEDQRAALALIATLNPLAEPRGERKMDQFLVRWHAEPLTRQLAGTSRAGLPTAFDLRLYELDVETLRPGEPVHTFKVRRTGWLLARPFNPNEF